MGADVNAPPELADRIIDDRLAKVTAGFHRETGGIASGEGTASRTDSPIKKKHITGQKRVQYSFR